MCWGLPVVCCSAALCTGDAASTLCLGHFNYRTPCFCCPLLMLHMLLPAAALTPPIIQPLTCALLFAVPAETRTPALTSDEAKSFTSTGRDGGQPTIASPREQPSLGEGSVGVSAGDPAGGANVVSAAKAAGRGLLVSHLDPLLCPTLLYLAVAGTAFIRLQFWWQRFC